ncbi:MAG: hypothetical protein ACPIOQ_50810, partial [Promethearchaeia archaeon]
MQTRHLVIVEVVARASPADTSGAGNRSSACIAAHSRQDLAPGRSTWWFTVAPLGLLIRQSGR